jgi:exodeoxyribonuclease VII large subunit
MRDVLDGLGIRCSQSMKKKIDALSSKLQDLSTRRVMVSPSAYVDTKRLELDREAERLYSSGERTVADRRRAYIRLASSLDAMSPLKVLSRGYSVAQREGKLIRSIDDVTIGESIELELRDGVLDCRVENSRENKNG